MAQRKKTSKSPRSLKSDAPRKSLGSAKSRGNGRGNGGPRTIGDVRRELDKVDRNILKLLNDRAKLAQEIATCKQSDGRPIYDAQRETEVLAKAVESNRGPLGDGAVRAVFRELISGSRALQTSLRVAFLGPEYTYSHLASIERFGQSAELMPVATIAAVFDEVQRGHAEFGVVPMENSTDGRVSDTLECFSRSSVRICGELPLRIHHCLLGTGRRDRIRTVVSKPQALSQCRNWLAQHLPQAEAVPAASTAEAANRAKTDTTVAAIASLQVGINYGLPTLAENIEDNDDNVTRFAIIALETAARTGSDKTSIMMEIAHEPGALADSMGIFKRNRLNMTWIESFPIPGARGRYLFFVEFIGHQDDLRARRAIAALGKKAQRLAVLGSYAQTEPVG